jgi:hypothetical protein
VSNDTVFALTVRHVVGGRHSTLRPKNRVPPLLFLGHDAGHGGGIAVGGLGLEDALRTVATIRVTTGKATPEAGENARVTFALSVLGTGYNTGPRQIGLVGLVGLQPCQGGAFGMLASRALVICLIWLRRNRLGLLAGQA